MVLLGPWTANFRDIETTPYYLLHRRAEMEQQEDLSRQDLAAKRGRAQQELDSRFGDAFGASRHAHHDKRPRR